MKIAFINIYQGAIERGAETFVSEVSKRLSEKHNVKVYGLSRKPFRRWPILWRLYLDPHGIQTFWYTLKLIPSLWKEKFDVVIPVNGGWQPALVRLVTWLYGGKMVISGQSGLGWDDRNNLWCFPDHFVALTEYAQKWAKRANPFVKTEVIANGADVNKFAGEKSKIILNLEKPVILCVGALTASKRQDLAIKAVSKLEKGSLLLVGKGEKEKYLRELGYRLLKDRFKIDNFIHKDMPKVYKSADIFTYPTASSESFGIVIVEALAAGLPVVVNDDPIRREIAGEAGIYVDPENTDKYAQALEMGLSKSPNRDYLNQAKKYGWDEISEKYEYLINNLVK